MPNTSPTARETSEHAPEQKDKYLLSSLNDALSVVDVLSHYRELSLTELARITGFDKARLFRMMYTLERNGYVAKSPEAKYRLGLRLLYLGSTVAAHQDIAESAAPAMRAFCDRYQVSTHLGRLSRDRIATVRIENPDNDLLATGRVGMNAPVYATAMGRAILANIDGDELRALAERRTFKRYTADSLASLDDLRELIARVRAKGYATDLDERFVGFGSIAAPVFDHAGTCVAAVGCVTVSPVIREREDELARAVIELAGEVSRALGYRDPLDEL